MTQFVRGALTRARKAGAKILFVTCDPKTELQTFVDLTIAPAVGPEVIAGSTRLKAGTATKLVLNMLTTTAMVRTGKTYGNLMVDVRSGSEKLKDRARRIVNIITGLDYDAADALLRKAKWNVKAAVVMQKTGLPLEKAHRARPEGQRISCATRSARTSRPTSAGCWARSRPVSGRPVRRRRPRRRTTSTARVQLQQRCGDPRGDQALHRRLDRVGLPARRSPPGSRPCCAGSCPRPSTAPRAAPRPTRPPNRSALDRRVPGSRRAGCESLQQSRRRLVEPDVAVAADPQNLQIDPAGALAIAFS